jgi:hypothetical protein
MRRVWAGVVAVSLAVLVSLLAASTAATAGFKHGRYAGTTDQGSEISFKATNGGVKRFSYSVTIQCDDGTMREFTTGESAKAPISENGRFTAEFVTPHDSITSVVDGKLKRRKARGSIETAGTVEGGWECHGGVAWTAKRQ